MNKLDKGLSELGNIRKRQWEAMRQVFREREIIVCSNCGTEYHENVRICEVCGVDIVVFDDTVKYEELIKMMKENGTYIGYRYPRESDHIASSLSPYEKVSRRFRQR